MNMSTQFLSYKLAGEEFALDISKVREVLDLPKITRLPRMPEFMRGVINLRGQVVPVVDQRLKFGLEGCTDTHDTRIIIMEIDQQGERVVVGAIADAVNEVMDMEPENIEPPPRMGTRLDINFIQGMGKKDEEFVIILNVDKIFSSEELSLLSDAQDGHAEQDSTIL